MFIILFSKHSGVWDECFLFCYCFFILHFFNIICFSFFFSLCFIKISFFIIMIVYHWKGVMRS